MVSGQILKILEAV